MESYSRKLLKLYNATVFAFLVLSFNLQYSHKVQCFPRMFHNEYAKVLDVFSDHLYIFCDKSLPGHNLVFF